jgi:hypothetical protein
LILNIFMNMPPVQNCFKLCVSLMFLNPRYVVYCTIWDKESRLSTQIGKVRLFQYGILLRHSPLKLKVGWFVTVLLEGARFTGPDFGV